MGNSTSHVDSQNEKSPSQTDILNNVSRLFSLRNRDEDTASLDTVNWNDFSESGNQNLRLSGGQQVSLGNILDTEMTMTDDTTNTNNILKGGCPTCTGPSNGNATLYGGMASETEAMKKMDTISSLPSTPHSDTELSGGDDKEAEEDEPEEEDEEEEDEEEEPEEEEEAETVKTSETPAHKKSGKSAKGQRNLAKKDSDEDTPIKSHGDNEDEEQETEGGFSEDRVGSVDTADVHALPFYSNESTSEFLFPKK